MVYTGPTKGETKPRLLKKDLIRYHELFDMVSLARNIMGEAAHRCNDQGSTALSTVVLLNSKRSRFVRQ